MKPLKFTNAGLGITRRVRCAAGIEALAPFPAPCPRCGEYDDQHRSGCPELERPMTKDEQRFEVLMGRR